MAPTLLVKSNIGHFSLQIGSRWENKTKRSFIVLHLRVRISINEMLAAVLMYYYSLCSQPMLTVESRRTDGVVMKSHTVSVTAQTLTRWLNMDSSTDLQDVSFSGLKQPFSHQFQSEGNLNTIKIFSAKLIIIHKNSVILFPAEWLIEPNEPNTFNIFLQK